MAQPLGRYLNTPVERKWTINFWNFQKYFWIHLIALQDRHRGELQQWKVRLEEQQERNNTLVEVNKELRQQLDVATENSDKLLKDVNRLGDNWEKLNRELLEKEKVQWCPDLVYPNLVDCRDLVD